MWQARIQLGPPPGRPPHGPPATPPASVVCHENLGLLTPGMLPPPAEHEAVVRFAWLTGINCTW